MLDANIQEACNLELCKGKHKLFSDATKLDNSSDVIYFKTLI